MEIFNAVDVFITSLLNDIGWYATILACMLMLIESMVPMLPLSVFITINFYYMGALPGFLISWILTCCGCYLSFWICREKLKKGFDSRIETKNYHKTKRLMDSMDKLKLEQLVVLIAIPFTPAFLINIAAGLSNMHRKKYITAVIIGKIFLVYFWGFVGTSLIESLEDPTILIKIIFIIALAFIVSKVINKKYNIE